MLSVASTRTRPKSSAIITAPGEKCGLAKSGLEVSDPDRDHLPGENWAGEVARALAESEAMVVLLTPAAVGSPHVKRNIEYALGAKNYGNRLIPVVVGGRDRFPAAEIPWIVRRMPWFELDDADAESPKVEPIAEARRLVVLRRADRP